MLCAYAPCAKSCVLQTMTMLATLHRYPAPPAHILVTILPLSAHHPPIIVSMSIAIWRHPCFCHPPFFCHPPPILSTSTHPLCTAEGGPAKHGSTRNEEPRQHVLHERCAAGACGCVLSCKCVLGQHVLYMNAVLQVLVVVCYRCMNAVLQVHVAVCYHASVFWGSTCYT